MTKFVIVDESGLVKRFGQAREGATLPNGALVVVERPDWQPTPGQVGLAEGAASQSLGGMMVVDDWLVPAPTSPAPTRDGNIVTIPPCPLGTEIEIFDKSGGERMAKLYANVEGWTDTFEFPDAGVYLIEVSAPGAHVPSALWFSI